MPNLVIDPKMTTPSGFSKRDGTVAFYAQVANLVNEQTVLLDLGAGRASWYEDDASRFDVSHPRFLKDKVGKVIAVDVDPVVLQNRTAHECYVMRDNRIPLEDKTIDVIVADFVLEHIEKPEEFFLEVNRVLRSGGWFCARTPHKYNYVSMIAQLVKNDRHASVLMLVQPDRKEIDVFPTVYSMNTKSKLKKLFSSYTDHTYIYKSEPGYTFGSRFVYFLLSAAHSLMPPALCGQLFVFMNKPRELQSPNRLAD